MISFSKDRSFIVICMAVICVHALFLFWISVQEHLQPEKRRSIEKVIVRTVSLSPNQNIPQATKAVLSPSPIALKEPTSPSKENQSPSEEKHVDKKKLEEIAAPSKVEVKAPEATKEQPKQILKNKTPSLEPKKEEKPVKNSLPKKPSINKKPEDKGPSMVERKTTNLPKKPSDSTKKSNTATPNTALPKEKQQEIDVKKEQARLEREKAKAKEAAEMQTKQRELLAKAQESIAKIDQTNAKIASGKTASSSTMTLPGPIEKLQIDTVENSPGGSLTVLEMGYRDELASRLKLLLRLPEYGEVKVKLTLRRSGQVVSVVVVRAESQKNRAYIEKTLPSLTFSPFGSNFKDAEQYTFLISLSNE